MLRNSFTTQVKCLALRFVEVLSLGACVAILAGCWGESSAPSNGRLNIVPESVSVKTGSSVAVPFELVGSSGLVNQVVRFRVSDTSIAQVSPARCLVSSNAVPKVGCVITVTGRRKGAVRVIAESDGYASDESVASVDVGNGVGTISIDTYSDNPSFVYYQSAILVPFSFTVRFTPSTQATMTVPAANPIYVNFTDTAGTDAMGNAIVSYANSQCGVSTKSPTCTVTGTFAALAAPSAGFTISANIVGTWQQSPSAPFWQAAPIVISMTPTPTQSPGTITVASTNGSNQTYAGSGAPLFVNLSGNTLTTATYAVSLAIQNPNPTPLLMFYDGSGQWIPNKTSAQQTCYLNVDNTSLQNYQQNSIVSCGFNLIADPAGTNPTAAVQIPITVQVTALGGAVPVYANTINMQVDPPSQSPVANRTITLTNNSANPVVFGAVSGTAYAYLSPTTAAGSGSVACGPSALPATCPPGAGQCVPVQACPIGSTCAQGGSPAGGPWQCFWDSPALSGSAIASQGSTTITVPGYAGVSTGAQQIQWSGSYYALQCTNGPSGPNCPPLPGGVGAGPSGPYSKAEITYQANAVDYYDVSIFSSGVSNGLSFGPSPSSGKSAGSPIPGGGGSITTPYACGTAGLGSAQQGTTSDPTTGQTITVTLPGSNWTFAPTAANFPAVQYTPSDSPASYYAYVIPSNPANPTPCTLQSTCTNLKTSDSVCGWNYASAISTPTAIQRVCGTFQAWGTAYAIWGWTQTAQNPANNYFGFTNTVGSTNVGTLQLCNGSTYTPNSPPPAPLDTTLACGATNWGSIPTWPAYPYITLNANWQSYVLPTIAWLKQACPTCYTYAFDDPTSTFNCEHGLLTGSGFNMLDYTLHVYDIINTFN